MTAIAAVYTFVTIPTQKLDELKTEIYALAKHYEIFGLMILGTEGINATVASTKDRLEKFIGAVEDLLKVQLNPKWSEADKIPFQRFKVKLRAEIVTLGDQNLVPNEAVSGSYLSPTEWNKMLASEDVIVVDTRNWYETNIGKFKSALDLNLQEFREFGTRINETNLPRDKKYLIYCTGGIRCEKAILEMHKQGFDQVYQLEGGILKYLEEFPDREFEGECFVFDHRVAVDQHLQPTQTYRFCPHCGQPAKAPINCVYCDDPAIVCSSCLELEPSMKTCSKNCANHHRAGHKFRRHHTSKHRQVPATPKQMIEEPKNKGVCTG